MSSVHPIEILRKRLVEDFSDELPAGVSPVTQYCREPQFFPGASGLLSSASWQEVEPAATEAANEFLPVPPHGVVVVGNYQATTASYMRLLRNEIRGFSRTWGGLRQLLSGVAPSEVFLTNAYIGLPDLAKDTMSFPATPEHRQRCQELLATELELFAPRLVICLGAPAASMLARTASGLNAWKPWPTYKALIDNSSQVVADCRAGSATFTAIAVKHPSAAAPHADQQRDRQLISDTAATTRFV